jgi:hypothetical protein
MFALLGFLIYFVAYTFLFTTIANFFFPVTQFIAALILSSSIILSLWSSLLIPFSTFSSGYRSYKFPKIPLCLVFFAVIIWAVMAVYRPTTESDAIGYHLPLSLLMNYSVWYPGIGKLSLTFGFPNGTSVLASVFTTFGILSFENIPNLIIWLILGIGIFLVLIKNRISPLLSFFIALMYVFSPDMFWQSYNMGTDLPCACFLLFGLIALSEDNIEDGYFFLSLSATFKTIGTLAFLLALPYLAIYYLKRKKKISFLHPKLILSILIFFFSIARVYIATGNPVYPSWPLNLASWGISSDMQYDIIKRDLIYYSGVELTPAGFFRFILYLFLLPHKFNSSYWFFPFFLASFSASMRTFLSEPYYKFINLRDSYLLALVMLLLLAWLFYSPLFRFIAGVFMFVNIKLFIFTYKSKISYIYKYIILASLFITLTLFMFNAARHIYQNVIPVINGSPEAIDKFMPWVRGVDSEKFTVKYTDDGFAYSKSTTLYCQKMRPPCISIRSLENEDILVKEFRKYNKM